MFNLHTQGKEITLHSFYEKDFVEIPCMVGSVHKMFEVKQYVVQH